MPPATDGPPDPGDVPPISNCWDPASYRRHAAFVPELGGDVLALLGPREGERILDLGCGDGTLTRRLVNAGAVVVGVDASPPFVDAARAAGIDAYLMDAESLTFANAFDAVFSNAALHWMRDPDKVIAGVARALRPRGRFVGEMGGHGNVAAIVVALRAVLGRRGIEAPPLWYFPTAREYRARLEAHGFTVDHIEIVPRPTVLPTGLASWLHTFAGPTLARVGDDDRAAVVREIEDLLGPVLCDSEGQWTADYVRLRFDARKSSGSTVG